MPRKLALIMGNNDYEINPLKNCVNDATSFANVLRSVDCEVELQTNLKSEDMYECIKTFVETIQPDDFIIFFFAGHAVQWGDQNFLLPCDNRKISSGRDMQRYATNAQENINEMANMKPHFILFLLDCCREYWLPNTARSVAAKNQVGGLNKMIAPPGTLIAFACAPGQTASDRSSNTTNGIFTKYLLKHIIIPGIDIEMVLRKVAFDVANETNNSQIPYRVTSIMADNICLVPIVPETFSSAAARKSNSTTINVAIASNISSKSSQNTQLTMIIRRAIDSSGSVGSFYDIHRDCLLKLPAMATEVEKYQLHGTIRCELIDGKTEKSENLLKMIGIDDDLRLNILLNLTPRTGIATLVDHFRPADEYTRFLYIFYADREQRLPDDPTEARKCVKSSFRDIQATHIVTAVRFGIDVVVVLQLPNRSNTAGEIDAALGKIRARLNNSTDFSNFTIDDEHVLGKIDETKAYSNVSELTKMTSLLEICQYINGIKKKSETYRPLTYALRSTEWLYSNSHESRASQIPLEKDDSGKIEKRLIEILNQMKKVKYAVDSNANKWPSDDSKEPLLKAQNAWQSLNNEYEKVIERLRNLVLAKRSGQENTSEIDEALKHEDQTMFNENIRKLKKQVKDLETVICSSNGSQQQQFKHGEALQAHVNQNVDEQTVECKEIMENQHKQTCSSNEKITDNNQSTLSIDQEEERNRKRQSLSPLSPATSTSTTTSSSATNEIINVLLLGESGVGKSTFINAFVNYLAFKTLNQAESGRPVVLIPGSFLMTIGDHFEERIIKFGDFDNFNNEDFDHPDQSMTQHCKSYVFKLNHFDERKMRIIDTPGFGDTRGIDQDDLNMQHILEYINNLTHLNAVCFLLKPNSSRIHKFFQNCLSQILDVLGPDFRQNIIFCFTKSRSSFYTPGNTAPLLKDILKSLSTDRIPFNKENTFCFDNESFRYLVALQNLVSFDDYDKEEYKDSWSKSVHESKRLLNYICTQLSANPKQGKWQSVKHAELQINHMIRPMLEAMRNILRNMIIYDTNSSSKSIELFPRALCRPATVCFVCKGDLIQKGNFWIARDVPHELQKGCHSCVCVSSQHKPIDYQLEYEDSDKSSTYNLDEMKKNLSRLRRASVAFAHFLIYVARSSKSDPFLTGMTQMIGEENDIDRRKESYMNAKLASELRELLDKYEQQMNSIDPNQQHNELSAIYESIETVCEYPMVQIQMAAVKKTQNKIMKLYEYKVPENLASTTIRSTTTS